MKQFLSHFQTNFILGVTLLCNVAALPNDLISPIQETSSLDTSSQSTLDSAEGLASENPATPEQSTDPEDSTPPSKDHDNKEDEDDGDDEGGGKDDDPEDDPPELFDFNSDLIIRAVNPGYTTTDADGNKLNEAGEFIELENLTGSELALAGYTLQYDYGSGNTMTLFTFPEGSYMTGKRLLLSYKSSSDADKADLTYGRSLATEAGPLVLLYENEMVDSVCWRSDTYCAGYNKISKFNKTVTVRDLSLGDFKQFAKDEYLPYEIDEPSGLYLPLGYDDEDNDGEEDPPEEQKAPQCRGLEFSELLTYYTEDKSEQFIELFNPTGSNIILDGCQLNYKKKLYDLSGNIPSGAYYAYYLDGQFSLTKNPKDPSLLTLIDADGEPIDEVAYPNGQKKSTSYSRIFAEDGTESWQVTYAITPGAENIYQKFRNCEEGKIINEATGNCVKVTSLKASASSTAKVLAPCPAGQYRNPLTNRCKKVATTTSSTLKECAEGYERNPETNRCRKIKQPNDGADYAISPTETSNQTVFIGIGIVAIIILLGAVYTILQFRQEIARAARKARQRLDCIRKDLIARSISRHRNKKS